MLRLLFFQSALPYLLKTAEKRCFYTFTWIYNPLFHFIIGKIFSTFFEKNFYKMASLFPISEGVILARAPSGTLKTEYISDDFSHLIGYAVISALQNSKNSRYK